MPFMSPTFLLMFRSMAVEAVELVFQALRASEVQLVLQAPKGTQVQRVTMVIVGPAALRAFLVLPDSEVFRVLLDLLGRTERMVSSVLRGPLVPLDLKVLVVLLERLAQLAKEALLVPPALLDLGVFREFRDQPVRPDRKA